jgi:integrase
MSRTRTEGIDPRHSRSCSSRSGRDCNCKPTYQAHVWSRREEKRIRKTFPTLAAARAWRHDAIVSLGKGTMRAPTAQTVRAAADAWLAGARDGSIRTRSGDRYKPSAIRSYERALRLRVVPELGDARLSEVRNVDLQEFADRLVGDGLDASTIQSTLMPLRAIYRREVSRGRVAVNPTSGLELPAVRGKRDRIASPVEAAKLIASLPIGDRALWATAMYAGLRRGELMALRWPQVDLAVGVIRVERGWDDQEGEIELKSRASRRKVPIVPVLRDYLVEHKLRCDHDQALAFGTGAHPFRPGAVTSRADAAWEQAKLQRITLHEARHTFASLLIAAGVNAKAISTYMGHSSIKVTIDLYGHLMPGNEQEAAALLDAYLKRADDLARSAEAKPERATVTA